MKVARQGIPDRRSDILFRDSDVQWKVVRVSCRQHEREVDEADVKERQQNETGGETHLKTQAAWN